MGEKGANIDLLFRNGLKDYEVLPPPGVWDGIQVSGKVKTKPLVFFRVAAAITVLLSVSFLVYMWSRENSVSLPDDSLAMNIQASDPVSSRTVMKNRYLRQVHSNNAISENSASEEIKTIVSDPVLIDDQYSFPSAITVTSEQRSISLLKNEYLSPGLHSPVKYPEKKTQELRYADLQFMPDDGIVKERWSIGAMASPTYYSNFNSGSDQFSKQLSQSEEPMISYSGGVAFSYNISKRFSIQSGLYYSSLGQRLDGINSYGGFNQFNTAKGNSNFEVPTTSGTIHSNNPDVFLNSNASNRIISAFSSDIFDPRKASLKYINNSLTQSFSYLEFPVILRYKIIDKTIDVNLIGGMSYNLLVHNSVYTTFDGNKYQIGDTKGLNPLALSSSLGMGMEYNFSNKLSLNLEPTLRYYLNPFSVATGTFIHPYSFGIFSGITYKF